MKNIDKITQENFNESFNIEDILTDSVFYPASGIDGKDIECRSIISNSFVHVDYSTPKEVIKQGMQHHFQRLGYDLIGFKHVSELELTPNGFVPQNFRLNSHEQERLQSESIRDSFNSKNFIPFAFWAVYELKSNKTGSIAGKRNRFSLLHIGGEACATFEAVYIGNKINPLVISIINSSKGSGDNWTIFTNPEFRLYQNLVHNHKINNAEMPKWLLTNMGSSETEPCFWPEYNFADRRFSDIWLQLYRRE